MERIRALDFIRGVAIFGVGLANVGMFSYGNAMLLAHPFPETERDRLVSAFLIAFVDGKFITMLSLLFGAGLWILASRREPSVGHSGFQVYYLKRMAVLFGIGFLHVLLLWWGDILAMYAVVGAVAVFLRHVQTKTLLIIAGACWLFGVFSLLGNVLLASWIGMEDFDFYSIVGIDGHVAFWAEGGFLGQLGMRLLIWVAAGFSALFVFVPIVFGLFLIGVVAARELPLWDLKRMRATLLKVALICGPVGLLIGGVAALRFWTADHMLDYEAFSLAGAPFLSVAYASILAIWSLSGFLGFVQRAVEAVGRLALTCYLTQSVIFVFVFTSYGFGMMGRLDRLETIVVALTAWAFNILFSVIWLRFFEIGPVEWVWRSVVDGRARPLRRKRPQLEAAAAPSSSGQDSHWP